MCKRKKGESEAIAILKSIGIDIDEGYSDDNSQANMPDIRCKDGHHIEVTHTFHDDSIPTSLRKYNQLHSGETWQDYNERHIRTEQECSEALHRIWNADYERDANGKFTQASIKQYKKDTKLIKLHMGYDYSEMDLNKRHSEFKCDNPTVNFSTDNILAEITKDKGPKYINSNTDLFVFVTVEEYRLMEELLLQRMINGCAVMFLNQIAESPFPVIYICEWDWHAQKYNTKNPKVTKFYSNQNKLYWKKYH